VIRLLAVALALVAVGPNVDVSNLPGAQSEAAITIDPTNDQVLLAGSNSFSEGTMRAYGSTDGGATWQATTVFPAPKKAGDTCAADPGVAIDRTGRQYFSFVRSSPCQIGHPRLYVASRAGPNAAWGAPVMVAPLRGARFDDKPAIAVDRSPVSKYPNRVYTAWTRVGHDGGSPSRSSRSRPARPASSSRRRSSRAFCRTRSSRSTPRRGRTPDACTSATR
jgi:hypothetical protein